MDPESIYIERDELKTKLLPILKESDEGAVQLVWFIGETGQGKTFFLKHFLEEQKVERLCSYAACSSPLGNQQTTNLSPHQPLKDIIEDLLTSQGNVSRHRNLVKNISLTVLACMPIVGEIAYGIKEIRRDLNEFKSGNREVELEKFEEEYINTLMQLSDESPLILVIDDIQWADRQSILVLQKLFSGDLIADRKIVIILSGRNDEIQKKPDLVELYNQTIPKSNCSEIQPPPFDSRQIRQYIELRFPGATPDKSLLIWLEQKTGGNPFFLSSYIKHLVVEGVLSDRGKPTSDLLTYRGLPAEIRLVTNWLTKSLSEEDLILLLTASVLGYEFTVHELVYLTQSPVLEIIRRLRKIRALYGICEPIGYKLMNGKESTVYRFGQHAVHTALYNELSVEEKESLHRAIARYLHQLQLESDEDPEVLNSIASALALHAQLGNEPQLEYDSLLLKARNTSEQLDDQYILDRIAELSPSLGKREEELQQYYRMVSSKAPYATHQADGGRVQAAAMEDPELITMQQPLTAFVVQTLDNMREGDTNKARNELSIRISALSKRDMDVHPLLVILHALSGVMDDTFDLRSREMLEVVAHSSDSGLYAALANVMLAITASDVETDDIVRHLNNIAEYQGKYESVVRGIVLTFLQTRFTDDNALKSLLDASPLFQSHLVSADLVKEEFPRTYQALTHTFTD